MDKLQPIIRHKFWIFAAIAILTPIYPWMSTLSQMKAAYTTGADSIKSANGQIPSDKTPKTEKWVEPVKQLTEQQAGRYEETRNFLWEMQKPLLHWPEEIQVEIEKNKVPFWGEIPTAVLRTYKTNFGGYKYKLWQILKPFSPKAPQSFVAGSAPVAPTEKSKPGEELIAFPFVELPLPSLDKTTTDLNSKEVWEAQEDMWILESLFRSIAKVNREQPIPAQSQMNSVIKQIYKVELMGGRSRV